MNNPPFNPNKLSSYRQQTFPPPPPDTQSSWDSIYPQPVSSNPYAPHDFELRDLPSQTARSLPSNTFSPLQSFKEYVKSRIKYSSKKALRLRWIHNILQTIILVGAALVSISLGFPRIPSWLAPFISGIVTITTIIANYYKFGERSRDLYRSVEDIQREYNWFKLKRGSYKDLDEAKALVMFQDKIDVLKHEQFIRTFSFEKQEETQK